MDHLVHARRVFLDPVLFCEMELEVIKPSPYLVSLRTIRNSTSISLAILVIYMHRLLVPPIIIMASELALAV
jgi:hypothetical protein